LAAVFAIVCAVGLVSMGAAYAMPRPKAAALQEIFTQDFRGDRPLPTGLTYFNDGDNDFIKNEPEGARITLPEGYQHRWGGVGFITNLQFSGDFEITATVEVLQATVPPTGFGVGPAMRIEKVGYPNPGPAGTPSAATIARLVKPGGNQVAVWDIRYAANPGDDAIYATSGEPCTDTIGRLRLRRTGKTLYYEWGRGTTGDDFVAVHTIEFGPEDVSSVRLTALNGQQRVPVDVRLIDLTVRGGPASPSSKSHRWHGALAMLLGVGLLLSACHWFGGRAPRRMGAAE
jgi:hypothetical protein